MEGFLRSDMAGTGVGPGEATTTKRLTSESIVIHNVVLTKEEKDNLPPLFPETKLDVFTTKQAEYDKRWLGKVIKERENIITGEKAKEELVTNFNELPLEKIYDLKSSDFVPKRAFEGRGNTSDFVSIDNLTPKMNIPTILEEDVRPKSPKQSKAKNILGFLRRKSKNNLSRRDSTDSNRSQKSQRSDSSVFKETMESVGEEIENRFNLLKDTLAEHTDDEEDEDMHETVSVAGSHRSKPAGDQAQTAPPPDEDTSWHEITRPSFSKARALRDKRTRRVYTALTYHLKCKHFMHSRDPHFVRTLVQDARAWMTRQKLPTESYLEYAVLTSAVAAAFFVDQEELDFRARMKNRNEWQSISKINRAMTGDLGHRLFQVEPRFNTLRHAFQSRVRFPPTNIPSV